MQFGVITGFLYILIFRAFKGFWGKIKNEKD